jgi:tetratricopeptide (TPR) repeat protein
MRLIYIALVTLAMLPWAPSLYSQGQAQAQSKSEYDAYTELYDEQNWESKAALGEAFLIAYPDSEFLEQAFMNLALAYQNQGDWAHVLDTVVRFRQMVPTPEQDSAEFMYPRGLAAAQARNDVARIIEFGRLLLEVSPGNLGAMLTLATVYTENLPTGQPARGRALNEAYELANRARIQADQYYASETSRSAERTQVEVTVHTVLARVHYARGDYQRSADEYLQVVDLAPNDGDAYFRLGDCYQFLAAAASRDVESALAQQTLALEGGRDQGTIDQLQARYEDLQANVLAYLDRSIDFFATAAAVGGPTGPAARQRLEPLYRNRNEDSLDGLEELIQTKVDYLRSL